MDNAGGGLRGLRATPSQALLALVGDAYAIDTRADAIDLGGSANLNLLLGADEQRVVVRVYRPFVTADRLAAIQFTRQALADAGVPCGGLLHTRDGNAWVVVEGLCVEVERYVAHDAVMNSFERLRVGLPVLSRIHQVLGTLKLGPHGRTARFANAIAPEEVLGRTRQGAGRIRGWNPSPAERDVAAQAEELAHLVAHAERDIVAALPRQLIHGDFWDNNVFLRGNQVVHVADFDFLAERARIDDLALTLYFACLSLWPEMPADGQRQHVRSLLAAYDAGSALPLTAGEREALPLALARQPLWGIGGWVALLDDEQTARRHAAGMAPALGWALRLMRELDRWQAALA